MSARLGQRTVALAGTAIAAGFLTLGWATPALAAGPTGGSQVPGSALPIGKFTKGTPFSSGQVIQVKIPENSVLQSGKRVAILECSDGGGLASNDPTSVAACDANTIQGDTIVVGSDGSISYSNYTVYALPDSLSLGEPKTQTPICNLGHTCVLYIGENQNDFTQPHFFSQPFLVKANTDDMGANPGDGTPEAPVAIGLPILAIAMFGGVLSLRRRRAKATSKT